METENSRRTFDRSREPGLKKPRLTQDPTVALDRASNGRPSFMQRPAARGGDSESGDSIRGPYPQTQNDHVELVNQYRTALAELTFNSKPIITNLTIIAGENLHAAKAIASIVCSNILEVPRDQKLPSLYLLDSIVKNIGRDYIKYFGAKLPEVFCKAYRQVDPSTHPGMRHLFGTWKGVFPPQPLQVIEKELGFAAAVNRLPSGTTSRVDAPVSRPASIHVNPKYLEARQRLQQSTKSSQHIQREPSDVMRSKNVSPPFGDDEFDLGIPSQSGLEPGREKFSGNVQGTVSTQRNGLDGKHGVQNYPLDRRRQPNYGLTSQSTIPMNVSWKNSEEEEYIWDDMNSRVGEHDNGTSSARDHWSHDDSEKMSEASADSLSTEMKDQGLSGNLGLSSWSQEPPLPERIRSLAGRAMPSHSENYPVSISEFSAPNGRTSFLSKVGLGSIGSAGYGPSNTPIVGSTLSVVPQRQTLGDASSVQSLLYPPGPRGIRPESVHNLTARNPPQVRTRAEPRTYQHSGSSNKDPRTKLGQVPLPLPSQNTHLPNKRVHSPNTSSSFSAIPSQLKEHTSFPQQIKSEPDLSHQVQKPFSHALSSATSFSDDQIPLPSLPSGQSSTNSLLAAVSGILKSNSIFGTFSLQSSQTSVAVKSEENKLPLSSVPSQTQSSPSMSISPLSSLAALSSILPQRKADGSPLSFPITAALSSSSLAQSTKVTDAKTPVSSLLSSLVAKGLISATKTESTSILAQPKNHSPQTASASSLVSLPLTALPISSSCTVKEESSSEPVSVSTELPPSPNVEMKSLIGFQFKGDVLRRLHPAVISQLFEDFPHKCGICEGRLKIEDHVGRHLEWHALRNGENNSNKASRIWYANSNSILADAGNILSADEPSGPSEGLTKRTECSDLMVPADESQCLCILCGELFEDYYDQGMAQWMFKGAVYANVPCYDAVTGCDEDVVQDSIVHERCISKLTPNTPGG